MQIAREDFAVSALVAAALPNGRILAPPASSISHCL